MSVAIIGWTGFIGQSLLLENPSAELFNSSNIEEIRGKQYSIVYMAGMPAEKWRINKDPAPDRAVLEQFKSILSSVQADTFVLISTVDVLDCTVAQPESGTAYATHPYGLHRRLLEEFVTVTFPTSYILRLPGLFGKGLKKNALYDLIHNNQVSNISLAARFQWYNVENLSVDIQRCISNNIRIAHVVSEPVAMVDIVDRFFKEKAKECTGTATVSYVLTTDHGTAGVYWNSATTILDDMEKYIHYEKRLQSYPNTISISNIAWEEEQHNEICKILSRYRINHIELAPTKISPWTDWSDATAEKLLKRPFQYPSCQSILFNKPIEIFKQPDEFVAHYTHVAAICQKLGVKTIVFGSPKARHRYDTTDDQACALFRQIAEISRQHNVICCMEPNAKQYGCTWLTNLNEIIAFVNQVNHPHVRINYDLGNYLMEGDTFLFDKATVALIGNTQVSYRFLQPLTKMNSEEKSQYKSQIQQLRALGYTNNISLEMIKCSYAEFIQSCNILFEII